MALSAIRPFGMVGAQIDHGARTGMAGETVAPSLKIVRDPVGTIDQILKVGLRPRNRLPVKRDKCLERNVRVDMALLAGDRVSDRWKLSTDQDVLW